MNIDVATVQDWDEIRTIYRDGVLTGEATFNTVDHIPVSGDAWFDGKVMVFKAAENGAMLGWSTLSATSKRPVYQGVTEISIYVSPAAQGRGVGSALMAHTLAEAEKAGIWTIEARIFPSNTVSIRLHEKFGFRVLGVHDKRAQQFGVWRDVAYLEWRARPAKPLVQFSNDSDIPTIRALLKRNDLPTEDVKTSTITLLIMRIGDQIVGCVGLERHGDCALLRSLTVDGQMRGQNLGTQLVETAEQFAHGRNINTLWLLTTTAAPFFTKLGYETVERSAAPDGIRGSAEFAALCPDSAVCMTKTLHCE